MSGDMQQIIETVSYAAFVLGMFAGASVLWGAAQIFVIVRDYRRRPKWN